MPFLYLFLSFVLLFLTIRFMTGELSRLVHRLGGSRRLVINLWSIVFLPGTLIHEISHFLVAALFGARTGRIAIFPEFLEEEIGGKNQSGHVTLGYVQVQALNPIAGFFVGIAPFLSGVALLIWLASLIQSSFSQSNTPVLALELYFFFAIANSFFPSWADLKQTLPLVLISSLLFLVVWLLGFSFSLSVSPQLVSLMNSLRDALLISVALNSGILLLLFSLNRLTKLHR